MCVCELNSAKESSAVQVTSLERFHDFFLAKYDALLLLLPRPVAVFKWHRQANHNEMTLFYCLELLFPFPVLTL